MITYLMSRGLRPSLVRPSMIFSGPGEIGIDDDDPRAGLERPRRMLSCPQPVEIVEHLERRRIPVCPVRRLRSSARAAAGATAAAGGRGAGQAEIDEGAAVILSRGGLGLGDMGVNLIGGCLGQGSGAQEHCEE